MKKKLQLTIFLILLGSVFLTISCKKKIEEVKSPPQVTTNAITDITETSVTCGGNITSDGGSPIIARGVCWSSMGNPSINDSKTSDGTGIGSFNSIITGFSNATSYSVRAYATNSIGTSYGNVQQFNAVAFPKLSTSNLFYEVSGNSARIITSRDDLYYGPTDSDGGKITNPWEVGTLSAFGLCWSINQNPTISDNHTNDFTSPLTNLTPNTNYYIRAYATNALGTGYGNQITLNSGYLFGSTVQGGLVFYNDGTGHGLVCASNNQSNGAIFGCYGSDPFGGGYDIFTGEANTNYIVTVCTTSGIAAKICYDLTNSGYSDWFLPSDCELRSMYDNLYHNGLGGFSNATYWSSTADGYATASTIDFYPQCGIGSLSKSDSYHVRAARKF